MNLAITLPRGLRHPSWYIPLLLPVIPGLCAYVGDDSVQRFACLLAAAAMLAIGLLYSAGLAAWMDRAPRLIRKEVEQLRPAWMVGLFGAQCGLLFRKAYDLDGVLVIPSLMFALLAALSFGIEFQQRTMPSLLCAPIDRARLWRIKMGVLAVAILSQVLVLAVSGAFGQWTQDYSFATTSENTLRLVGFALAFAFAAWASVPLWTLLTRNLLAGLVFAIFVPTFTFSLIGNLALWLLSLAGFTSDLGIFVFWTLTGSYLLSAPWLAWRRWLHLEAPDLPEREMSGLFLRQRQSSASRATRKRSWFAALIGKELRLQTVTLVCLGVAVMLTVAQAYLPPSVFNPGLAPMLIGLFAVLSILLAGSTAIAEERRLGTLDPQVLLPISRTAQWFLKLAVSLAIAGTAIALLYRLVPSSPRAIEILLPFGSVVALFVFSFLASSAAPNSLRALILGIAFTAAIIGVCSFVTGLGLAGGEIRLNQPRHQAMDNPEPWLAHARALSETEVAALESPIVPRFLPALINGSILAALVPLLLALGFSRHNFAHPAAAARRMRLQFPLCLLATLLLACSVVGGMLWLNHQANEQSMLRLARKEVELVDRLSPAELQLFQAKRRPLDEHPELLLVRKRNPPGGVLPPPDPANPDPTSSQPNARRRAVAWVMDHHRLPLTPQARAVIILDGEVPEDIREALRQEALAKGDPGIPTTPGRPPGLWPDRNAQGGYQMSPDLMRRYGLAPQEGQAVMTDPTANPPPVTTNAPTSTPGNPSPQFNMSPELMRRYGLVPPTLPETATNSPAPAPATSTPPKP
jgi:ABC-type transport system involved in multi-copper enzyme maturation permease subunit